MGDHTKTSYPSKVILFANPEEGARCAPYLAYIPHSLGLKVDRKRATESVKKGTTGTIFTSVRDHLFKDYSSDAASVLASEPGSAIEAIYLLKEELVSNQALEDQVSKRVISLPNKKLYINSL